MRKLLLLVLTLCSEFLYHRCILLAMMKESTGININVGYGGTIPFVNNLK